MQFTPAAHGCIANQSATAQAQLVDLADRALPAVHVIVVREGVEAHEQHEPIQQKECNRTCTYGSSDESLEQYVCTQTQGAFSLC
jgi:hypothetical protein